MLHSASCSKLVSDSLASSARCTDALRAGSCWSDEARPSELELLPPWLLLLLLPAAWRGGSDIALRSRSQKHSDGERVVTGPVPSVSPLRSVRPLTALPPRSLLSCVQPPLRARVVVSARFAAAAAALAPASSQSWSPLPLLLGWGTRLPSHCSSPLRLVFLYFRPSCSACEATSAAVIQPRCTLHCSSRISWPRCQLARSTDERERTSRTQAMTQLLHSSAIFGD